MTETIKQALYGIYVFLAFTLITLLSCLTGCTFNIAFSDTDGASKNDVEQKAEQPVKLTPEASANLLKL